MLCIVEQARFIFPKHPPVAVCQDPCGFLFARSQPHWILEPLFFPAQGFDRWPESTSPAVNPCAANRRPAAARQN